MSKKKKTLLLHMRCLILGVKRQFSPGLFVINLDYKLATVTIWPYAHCQVGQVNVRVKAVDSQDNRTLEIETLKL